MRHMPPVVQQDRSDIINFEMYDSYFSESDALDAYERAEGMIYDCIILHFTQFKFLKQFY